MTKSEINQYLCAIITTLAEVPYSPESTLYLAIGGDLDKWNTLKALLINSGLMTCSGFSCTLTITGHAMAAKINAALAAK